MAQRDSFLFRTDPHILDAIRRWAKDELRSANAQLEFIVRQALQKAGRLPGQQPQTEEPQQGDADLS